MVNGFEVLVVLFVIGVGLIELRRKGRSFLPIFMLVSVASFVLMRVLQILGILPVYG